MERDSRRPKERRRVVPDEGMGEFRQMRTSIIGKAAAMLLAAVMALALIGCSGQPLSTREKGTGIGALLGAGTGAGFLVGNELQNQEVRQSQTQSQINAQQREIENQRRQIQQLQQQQEVE